MNEEEDPLRFGAEFGPKRTGNSTGVSLSTFKTLVWVSNLGGLLLVVIGLELMMVQAKFYMALFCIVAGVIIALGYENPRMAKATLIGVAINIILALISVYLAFLA